MLITDIISDGISLEIVIKILGSAVLGCFIGLEREIIQQRKGLHEFGGIRTFTLISILGFISSFLSTYIKILPIIVFIALFIFIFTHYYYDLIDKVKSGITSEVSAFLTFLIGILTYFSMPVAIITAILTALILSEKKLLHTFAKNIQDKEFTATVEFAIFAFIVLPILPTEAIDPWGIFVPYEIWILILFILGVSFIGYILNRVMGEHKGTILTGIIGGIGSSTALTQAMSEKSKQNTKSARILACGTIVASTVMFIRVSILVGILNINLIKFILIPIGIMFVVSIAETFLNIYKLGKNNKSVKHKSSEILTQSPFKLASAFKFAVFFVLTLFITEIAKNYFGSSGIYIAAIISGIVDVDVFALSMVKMSQQDPESTVLAAKAIALVVASNMFFKGTIAYIFGTKDFSKIVLKSFAFTALTGVVAVLMLDKISNFYNLI